MTLQERIEARLRQNRLREDTSYQAYFFDTLETFKQKFKVGSLESMSDAQKREFFDYVDRHYQAKTES